MREAWGGRRGGKCGEKRQNTHLTGAPRDWAGFSMTVMVVSVSLRGESVSYSGMDGAAAEQSNTFIVHQPLPLVVMATLY